MPEDKWTCGFVVAYYGGGGGDPTPKLCGRDAFERVEIRDQRTDLHWPLTVCDIHHRAIGGPPANDRTAS